MVLMERLFVRAFAPAIAVALLCPWSFAQAPPAPQAKYLVVLDAAHGGSDSGAHLASGQLEKTVTLALSVKLRSLLAARGFQVVTTRESDAEISSDRRAEIANRAQPRACLSIHASDSGSGVHLFASSLAPAQPQRFIPWKTVQAQWVTRSLALTGAINASLQQAGLAVTLARTALPGLDSMACPAIAIEIAPERDARQTVKSAVDDPAYQSRVAEALAAGLLVWRSEPRQP
jgi:N-acetylmuramoyl-L-alanine amidase